MDFVTFGFGLGALLMLAGYMIRDHGRKLLFGDGQWLEGMPPSPTRAALDRTTLHAFAAGLNVAGFVAAATTFVALISGLSDFHGAIVVGVVVVLAIIGAGYWGYDVLRRHAVDAAIIDQQDIAERRRAARESAKKPAAAAPAATPSPAIRAAAPAASLTPSPRDDAPTAPAVTQPTRSPAVDDDSVVVGAGAPPLDASGDRPTAIANAGSTASDIAVEQTPAARAGAASASPATPNSSESAFGEVLPPAPPAQASPLAARFGGLPAGWQAAPPAPTPPFTRQQSATGAAREPEAETAARTTVPPLRTEPPTDASTPDGSSPAKPAWSPWSVSSASSRAAVTPPAPSPSQPTAPVAPTAASSTGTVATQPAVASEVIAPAPAAQPPVETPLAEQAQAPEVPAELEATAPIPTAPTAAEPVIARRQPVAPATPAGAPPGYQPPDPEPAAMPPAPIVARESVMSPAVPKSEDGMDAGTPVELLPLRVAPRRRFGKPSVSTKPASTRPGDAPARRPVEGEPEPSLLGYEHVFEQDQDADLPAWPGERPAAVARPVSPEPPADGRSLTDPAAYAQRGASPTWLFDDLEDELAAMPAPKEEPIDPFRFVRPVKKISVLDKLLAEGPATNGEPNTSGK